MKIAAYPGVTSPVLSSGSLCCRTAVEKAGVSFQERPLQAEEWAGRVGGIHCRAACGGKIKTKLLLSAFNLPHMFSSSVT